MDGQIYCCDFDNKIHFCGNTKCEKISEIFTFDIVQAFSTFSGICCIKRYVYETLYCFYCYKANVQPRVLTWLLIGNFLGFPKDVTRMIGKLIWKK